MVDAADRSRYGSGGLETGSPMTEGGGRKAKRDIRPWKIQNRYLTSSWGASDRTKSYSTVEKAMAAAIFEVLIEDVGSWRQLVNWEDNVAYRVAHIIDGQILIQRMIWGPDERWIMK